MPSKVWGEIIYALPNFNSHKVKVLEWINIFIAHFIMNVMTYPWWD